MKHLRRIFLRSYLLFANSKVEAELAREIDAHLALLEDEYLRQGMTPEDARRAARLAYGGVEQATQLHRDERAFQGLGQILEHILGAPEGWFGVDHPVFAKQRSQPGGEEFGLREPRQIPGKVQLASLKGQLESGDELAAKHLPENGNGEKEARVRSNPAGVIEREPAGGDDTMDMGMNLEFLVPGM